MKSNTDWVANMLGGVTKSQVLKPDGQGPLGGLHRTMVDLVCKECATRVGVVTDEPEGALVTVWSPTMVLHPVTEGEPIWTVFSGVVPDAADVAPVHCFRHGGGEVLGKAIAERVSAYRRTGKRRRIAVEVHRS